MKLDKRAALMLAEEPGLTGADLRTWLALVDREAHASELAATMGIAPTNAAASCRRLYRSGWLDIVEEVGRAKRYTARSTRSDTVPLPGQLEL